MRNMMSYEKKYETSEKMSEGAVGEVCEWVM